MSMNYQNYMTKVENGEIEPTCPYGTVQMGCPKGEYFPYRKKDRPRWRKEIFVFDKRTTKDKDGIYHIKPCGVIRYPKGIRVFIVCPECGIIHEHGIDPKTVGKDKLVPRTHIKYDFVPHNDNVNDYYIDLTEIEL